MSKSQHQHTCSCCGNVWFGCHRKVCRYRVKSVSCPGCVPWQTDGYANSLITGRGLWKATPIVTYHFDSIGQPYAIGKTPAILGHTETGGPTYAEWKAAQHEPFV